MKMIGDDKGHGIMWTGFDHSLDMIGKELAVMIDHAWTMVLPEDTCHDVPPFAEPMKDGAAKYGGYFGGALVYFARDYFAKNYGTNMIECVNTENNALVDLYRPMPPPTPPTPPYLPSTCSGDDDISSCCTARKYTSTTFLSTGYPDETAYMECCERPSYYGCPNFCSDSDGATDVAACCADGPYNYDECCKNPKGYACEKPKAPIKLCGMTCAEVIPYGTDDPHCPLTWSVVAHALCGQEPPAGFTMESFISDVCPDACAAAPAADIKICGQTCAEVIPYGTDDPHCPLTWSVVAHALCGQQPPEGFTMESLMSDVCPDACAAAPAADITICGLACAEAVADDPQSHCTIKWSEVHALCGQAPPEGFTMQSFISDVCPDACAAAPAAPAADIKICGHTCAEVAPTTGDPHCDLTWSQITLPCGQALAPPEGFTVESFIWDVCPDACVAAPPADIKICGQTCAERIHHIDDVGHTCNQVSWGQMAGALEMCGQEPPEGFTMGSLMRRICPAECDGY